MRKLLLLIVLVITSIVSLAQAPNNYYSSANNKTGEELKAALHEIIKDHDNIGYDAIWSAFFNTDHRTDYTNKVWDIYSDIPGGTPKYYFTLGDGQCGSYEEEGDCYNREHAWPQSWLNNQGIPSADLHHIFPTDGFVNSKRSNFPYGEVQTATWTSQNQSKLGTCKPSLGYTGTVFEPIDEYKGDIARAFFYMSVRYYGEDDNWSSSEMTNKSEILPWAMTMLLQWNDDDPVSQKEIDRNNVIYNTYQHNRNPFIDNSEYARMIWDPNWTGGGVTPTFGDYVKVTSVDELADGDYLIVCESNNVAFDGALSTLDAVGNKVDISFDNGTIASTPEIDAAVFTINSKTGGYSIKSASGYYIGNTSDANTLKSSQNDDYTNSISFTETDGDVVIISSSSHLMYNNGTNQTRFRYYRSSTYTSQQPIQLYKKNVFYTLTCAQVEHGSVSANLSSVPVGATITLTATPDEGYELDHWTVTDDNNNLVTVDNNQFEMPASNVTVSATFVYVGLPFASKYYLVTSTDQLVAGRTYLIVNSNKDKAMGASSANGNNRTAVDIIVSNDIISELGNACELTLGIEGDNWTLFDANWGNTGGYLYAGSSSSNYLKTQASYDANGQWNITINSDHTATIVAQGTNKRNTIKYNNGSTLFSCYSSGQQEVRLFIRSEEQEHTQSETIANIFAFDKHVIPSGTTLTVTGTVACTEASQLVIEDGGQLIHHTDGVKAIVKKSITGYSRNGNGWYAIAAPFTDFTPGQIAVDTYDLYIYDEDGSLEWINYKAHTSGFPVSPYFGYLYAHNPATTLRMNGTLVNGNDSETVNLSYGNSHAEIKGFNLLGNPTAHDITFTKSSEVSDGYYYLNNSANWEYTTGNTVPMGWGFMVKANASGQTVTLNPQSRGEETQDVASYLGIEVDGDRAYVKMTEGVSMPLLGFRDQSSSVYLSRDGKPYIMLVSDGASRIELNYSPKSEGQHHLSVDVEGLTLPYLHLVDRLTGADIDLLQTPSYHFESNENDYASRFLLVFNADGQIDTDDDDENATWQVIDMLGRIVATHRGSTRHLSTQNLTPGVYVLRQVNGNDVKTQKINVTK